MKMPNGDARQMLTRAWFPTLFLSIGLIGCTGEPASVNSDNNATPSASPTVVPEKEIAIAADKSLDGPSETQGIESVDTLVGLALAEEFASMEDYQLRARILVLSPGATVAVHEHDRRPGFAYILEGEIVEHRNDEREPIVRRVGDVAIERTGISHWWENRSSSTVKALVVDLVPIED